MASITESPIKRRNFYPIRRSSAPSRLRNVKCHPIDAVVEQSDGPPDPRMSGESSGSYDTRHDPLRALIAREAAVILVQACGQKVYYQSRPNKQTGIRLRQELMSQMSIDTPASRKGDRSGSARRPAVPQRRASAPIQRTFSKTKRAQNARSKEIHNDASDAGPIKDRHPQRGGGDHNSETEPFPAFDPSFGAHLWANDYLYDQDQEEHQPPPGKSNENAHLPAWTRTIGFTQSGSSNPNPDPAPGPVKALRAAEKKRQDKVDTSRSSSTTSSIRRMLTDSMSALHRFPKARDNPNDAIPSTAQTLPSGQAQPPAAHRRLPPASATTHAAAGPSHPTTTSKGEDDVRPPQSKASEAWAWDIPHDIVFGSDTRNPQQKPHRQHRQPQPEENRLRRLRAYIKRLVGRVL